MYNHSRSNQNMSKNWMSFRRSFDPIVKQMKNNACHHLLIGASEIANKKLNFLPPAAHYFLCLFGKFITKKRCTASLLNGAFENSIEWITHFKIFADLEVRIKQHIYLWACQSYGSSGPFRKISGSYTFISTTNV